MSDLLRVEAVKILLQSIGKGLVVSEDVEAVAFNKMPEVLDGEASSEQLVVRGTVVCRTGLERLGEEGNWAPIFTNVLLKNCIHCCVRSICHNAGGGVGDGMH